MNHMGVVIRLGTNEVGERTDMIDMHHHEWAIDDDDDGDDHDDDDNDDDDDDDGDEYYDGDDDVFILVGAEARSTRWQESSQQWER